MALGMSAKILMVHMNMYASACSLVKMNGELMLHFRCIKTGMYNLSPMLFNLYGRS